MTSSRRQFLKQVLSVSLMVGVGLNLILLMAQAQQAFKPNTMLMTANSPQTQIASIQGRVIEPSSFRVPLEFDNKTLVLDAKLNSKAPAKLILDTGATYTAISTELAESLGYDLSTAERVRITTANGQVSLPKITLESLTLDGYTAYNVEATVMTMPKGVHFDGLLGLSFIQHYQMTIDTQTASLLMTPHQS